MSYNISEITDNKVWDDFITSQQRHTFLHSWAWGDFNVQTGDKIWRLGIFKSGHKNNDPIQIGSLSGHKKNDPILIGSFLVIKVHARRGNFLFVPHGPVLAEGEKNHKLQIFKTITEKLKEIAKQEKVNFIRVSPLLEDTAENQRLFSELGFRPAPIHMHAETTWTLDLSLSEKDLLMGMRKTTRNLIRRAMKEGVEIKTGTSDREIEIFYDLYKETVKKHNFTPFSLTYLKNQTNTFKNTGSVKVFTAWHRGEAIASAIIIFYGNSAFYHHGASIQSKIPAAYLLQWGEIREAKRRGHKYYNFWGIIKEDATANHPWAGITLFKKGFGGFQSDYLHAQDLSVSWKYWPNYIFETLRRKKRGL